MDTKIYLYDANGTDEEIEFDKIDLSRVKNDQLLWIDVLKRDRNLIQEVLKKLALETVAVKSILNVAERPKIDIYENYYRFFLVSVKINGNSDYLQSVPIDFIVGKNFVVTFHQGEIDYFNEFRAREKGETQIGELDAESFIAALLDLHVIAYFRALEEIEARVDELDEKILKTGIDDDVFLQETIKLRKGVSSLRRWFLPHRDVFYALSHADFQQIVEDDSLKHFEKLNDHFEHAVDAIESARDTVLSLFDLYATKSAHQTNLLVKRLTFITLLVGALGAIAGVWGMNFEVEYFKAAETGFWLTLGGMALMTIALTIVAKIKNWI